MRRVNVPEAIGFCGHIILSLHCCTRARASSDTNQQPVVGGGCATGGTTSAASLANPRQECLCVEKKNAKKNYTFPSRVHTRYRVIVYLAIETRSAQRINK